MKKIIIFFLAIFSIAAMKTDWQEDNVIDCTKVDCDEFNVGTDYDPVFTIDDERRIELYCDDGPYSIKLKDLEEMTEQDAKFLIGAIIKSINYGEDMCVGIPETFKKFRRGS